MLDQERICFLFSIMRSGSTLLTDMLGLHSQLFAPPEPHVVAPLLEIGYFPTRGLRAPSEGPFDASKHALRLTVNRMPGGEERYFESLRAYIGTLYGAFLEKSGKRMFIDKTPANSAYCDLIKRVYPKARHVVLTRHPVDIAKSMFEFFQILRPGQPPGERASFTVGNVVRGWTNLAPFVRHSGGDVHVVRFEDLLEAPEKTLGELCAHLGVAFEQSMLNRENYIKEYWPGYGDPKTVLTRPRIEASGGSKPRKGPTTYTTPSLLLEVSMMTELAVHLTDEMLAPFGYRSEDIRARIERLLSLDPDVVQFQAESKR